MQQGRGLCLAHTEASAGRAAELSWQRRLRPRLLHQEPHWNHWVQSAEGNASVEKGNALGTGAFSLRLHWGCSVLDLVHTHEGTGFRARVVGRGSRHGLWPLLKVASPTIQPTAVLRQAKYLSYCSVNYTYPLGPQEGHGY